MNTRSTLSPNILVRCLPGRARAAFASFRAVLLTGAILWCYNTTHAGVSGLAVIALQPVAANASLGGSATFTVVATSATALSYQWRRNNVALVGATNSTLTINSAGPADAGVYSVVVTNAAGSVTSRPALLRVLAPPAITDQPDDVAVTTGRPAVFRVVASGAPVLAFQWEMSVNGGAFVNVTNGPQASGATSSTLVFRATTEANNGAVFRVRVMNLVGSALSANATLRVGASPAIVTQPGSATTVLGGSATFSVTATGAGTLRYQWRRNNANLEGATGAVLVVNNVSHASAGRYHVIVTSEFGTAVSAVGALRTASPPNIVLEPQSAAVIAGRPAVFRVRATGSARLSYQWQVQTPAASGFVNLAANATVSGATSSALVLRRTAEADDGNVYRVIVSNDVGVDTSAGAELNVGVPPAITEHPASVGVVAGGTVTLSTGATGSGPLAFQWLRNNLAITGATEADLVIAGADAGDQGVYRVVVRNAFGVAASRTARVALATPPAILDQPDDTGVVAGRPAVFRVRATGSARLAYQWQSSTGGEFQNVGNGSAAAGANGPVLVLRNTNLAANGTVFRVLVTNDVGGAASAGATLIVGNPPVITEAPQGLTVVAGANASLSAGASGTGPLAYQWLRNNVAISGATSATLDFSPADANDAGAYSVRITNSVGVAVSRPVRVVVTPKPQGIFVGGFAGAGARSGIAALVQADGDAVVVGFNHEHDQGLVAAHSMVALNGQLSGNTSQGGSVRGTVGARLIGGAFADGAGHSETFTAVRRPDAGVHAAAAGYYIGTFEDEENAGDVYAIVAADGTAFFYFVSDAAGIEGSAFVRVAVHGSITGVILPAAGILRGTLHSSTTSITGTYGIGVFVHGSFTLTRVLGL